MRLTCSMLCLLAGCQQAPPPRVAAPPFCTRTLGLPECFDTPYLLPDRPAPLADTPVRAKVAPMPWWQKIARHWEN